MYILIFMNDPSLGLRRQKSLLCSGQRGKKATTFHLEYNTSYKTTDLSDSLPFPVVMGCVPPEYVP